MPGLKGVRGGEGPTGDWIAQELLGCTRFVQAALPGTPPSPLRQPAQTAREQKPKPYPGHRGWGGREVGAG